MTEKSYDRKPNGELVKKAGWFSWRHESNDAHLDATEGRSRRETGARKRSEAEARDAALPVDSPKRRRNFASEVRA